MGSSRAAPDGSSSRQGCSSQSCCETKRGLCFVDEEIWDGLASSSYATYDDHRTALLRNADQAAASQADQLLAYKEVLARHAAVQPYRVPELLAECRSACAQTRQRLLAAEEALFKQLSDEVVDLFMHLRLACREFSEQSAALNVGRNIELELLQFNLRIKDSIKGRKDFLDKLHARRHAELERWCKEVASELETAVHAAAYTDDASTADGSVSDLLAGEDDDDDETADGSITDILNATAGEGDLMSTRDGAHTVDGSITDILSTFDTAVTMSSCFSSGTVGTRGSAASAVGRRGSAGNAAEARSASAAAAAGGAAWPPSSSPVPAAARKHGGGGGDPAHSSAETRECLLADDNDDSSVC